MATLFTKITAESAGASPYEFDAVNTAGSNTIAPSTVQVGAGSYSYETAYLGTSAIVNGYESFSSADEIYIKFNMFLSSDFALAAAWACQTLARIMDGAWHPLLRLAICAGGTSAPYRWYITGTNITDAYSTSEVTLNTWQSVEMYWKYDAGGNGEYFVKIDGTTLATDDGLSFTYTTGDRLYIGGTDEYSRAASGSEVYYDEIEGFDTTSTSTAHTVTSVVTVTTATVSTLSIRSIVRSIATVTTGVVANARGVFGAASIASVVSGVSSSLGLTSAITSAVTVISGVASSLGLTNAVTSLVTVISGAASALNITNSVTSLATVISGASSNLGLRSIVTGAMTVISGTSGTLDTTSASTPCEMLRVPYRRGNDEYNRLSRWGMTDVGQYGRGYQSDPIQEYFWGASSTTPVHYLEAIVSVVSGAAAAFIYSAFASAVVTVTSGVTASASKQSFISATVTVTSGTSATAGTRHGVNTAVSVISGLTGSIGHRSAIAGVAAAVSDMSAYMAQRYGITGAVTVVSDMLGDCLFVPGAIPIYGTISVVSHMFEVFRFLNPQTGYSPISEGLTDYSLVAINVAGASAVSTARDGASAVRTGFTYYSPISTGVDR